MDYKKYESVFKDDNVVKTSFNEIMINKVSEDDLINEGPVHGLQFESILEKISSREGNPARIIITSIDGGGKSTLLKIAKHAVKLNSNLSGRIITKFPFIINKTRDFLFFDDPPTSQVESLLVDTDIPCIVITLSPTKLVNIEFLIKAIHISHPIYLYLIEWDLRTMKVIFNKRMTTIRMGENIFTREALDHLATFCPSPKYFFSFMENLIKEGLDFPITKTIMHERMVRRGLFFNGNITKAKQRLLDFIESKVEATPTMMMKNTNTSRVNISKHLKVLLENKLVRFDKIGNSRVYKLTCGAKFHKFSRLSTEIKKNWIGLLVEGDY